MYRPSQSVGIFLSCVAALFSGTVLINILVGRTVPNVYMDEIFHVDQMQRYCQGRLTEWNSKITTPPGLYFTCLFLLKPVLFFLPNGADVACGAPIVLRYFNALFLTTLFCIYFALFRLLSAGRPCSSVVLSVSALNLTLFPLCYFFSFLFYTDVLSVNSVLLCYLLQIRRHHHWSALAGLYACAIRQTNIVWVAFCAALTFVDLAALYAEYFVLVIKNNPASACKSSSKNNNNSDFKHFAKQKLEDDATLGVDFYDQPLVLLKTLAEIFRLKRSLFINFVTTTVCRCSGYIVVALLAVLFVFWNGSIVLGDKSAHRSCVHLAQCLYCATFILGFGAPMIWSYIPNIVRRIKCHGLFSRVSFVVILLVIHYFTLDHPYLLADNRHYTFYIWKRWFLFHPAMKYLLAPVYIFALYAVIACLYQQSFIWRLLFAGACLAVTMPNRLLEFRYFILPYVMWRLHLATQSKLILLVEFVLYAVVNCITLYLFLFKPFEWSHEPGLQRFMW